MRGDNYINKIFEVSVNTTGRIAQGKLLTQSKTGEVTMMTQKKTKIR